MRCGRGHKQAQGSDRPSELGRWLRSTCQPPPRRARTPPAHTPLEIPKRARPGTRPPASASTGPSLSRLVLAWILHATDAAALAPTPARPRLSSRLVSSSSGGGGGGVQIRPSVRGLAFVFAHCCWPVSKSSSLAFLGWIRFFFAFRSKSLPFALCIQVGVDLRAACLHHPWFDYFSGTQDRSRSRTCLGSTQLPCPAPGPTLMSPLRFRMACIRRHC